MTSIDDRSSNIKSLGQNPVNIRTFATFKSTFKVKFSNRESTTFQD